MPPTAAPMARRSPIQRCSCRLPVSLPAILTSRAKISDSTVSKYVSKAPVLGNHDYLAASRCTNECPQSCIPSCKFSAAGDHLFCVEPTG
jgi:hypothetical protein